MTNTPTTARQEHSPDQSLRSKFGLQLGPGLLTLLVQWFIVTCLGLLFYGLFESITGDTIFDIVPIGTIDQELGLELPSGHSADLALIDLTFEASLTERLIWWLPEAAQFALTIFFSYHLMRILQSRPYVFTNTNVNRLRWMMATTGLYVATLLVEMLVAIAILDSAVFSPEATVLDLMVRIPTPLVLAAVLSAISSSWKTGTALHAEYEATV